MPLSLGSVCHLEEQMSQALAPAHAEAVAAVRAAEVKHADETSWRQAGKKRWLWLAATATVAAFVVHARRSLAGLQTLLGEVIAGVVISDRWKVYEVLPDGRRQLCWAHLIRDFRALSERRGVSRRIGEDLLALSGVLFEYWPKVRDGTHSRAWFVDEVLRAIRPDVQAVASWSALPLRGNAGDVPGVAGLGGIVVDVRLYRGRGADEQSCGARVAWCGVVAEGFVRVYE